MGRRTKRPRNLAGSGSESSWRAESEAGDDDGSEEEEEGARPVGRARARRAAPTRGAPARKRRRLEPDASEGEVTGDGRDTSQEDRPFGEAT